MILFNYGEIKANKRTKFVWTKQINQLTIFGSPYQLREVDNCITPVILTKADIL